MNQFDVTPFSSGPSDPPREIPPATEAVLLLRQLVDFQREQANLMRATVAAHDVTSRWRAFLTRWRDDFPDLPDGSRDALLVLERTYASMLAELIDFLRQNESGGLDSEFSLQEFLDRYGMRLAQLGTILNLVGPLAEASAQGESS
jgi:hypothetical protein